jgi:hypothetical protein
MSKKDEVKNFGNGRNQSESKENSQTVRKVFLEKIGETVGNITGQ